MDLSEWCCSFLSKWWTNKSILWSLIVLSLSLTFAHSDNLTPYSYTEAIVNITYKNPQSVQKSKILDGQFGINVLLQERHGKVVCVRSKDNETHGCSDYNMEIPSEKWIALIKRGKCPFSEKIRRAAKQYNATAVVIYDNVAKLKNESDLFMDEHDQDIVSVSLRKSDGEEIVGLLELGITVHMTISVGQRKTFARTNGTSNISKTSVLFVSISFIVLMIISLAWLVFYYIQRFRYAHAKERLARRLASAAKKAIAKIPQRNIKSGDKELDSEFDQCAVCIEGYKAHDVIRILPCKHVFHKSCVDPWLLEQRSCPMCKLDILRAYGMQVGGSEDCVHPDGESGGATSEQADEVEHTSITEEPEDEGQVKVLLLPHNCIHFHKDEIGESSLGSNAEEEDSLMVEHVSDSEYYETRSLMENSASDSQDNRNHQESNA